MAWYREGIANTIASSSARVAGLLLWTFLLDPARSIRHGFAAMRSSRYALFMIARSRA